MSNLWSQKQAANFMGLTIIIVWIFVISVSLLLSATPIKLNLPQLLSEMLSFSRRVGLQRVWCFWPVLRLTEVAPSGKFIRIFQGKKLTNVVSGILAIRESVGAKPDSAGGWINIKVFRKRYISTAKSTTFNSDQLLNATFQYIKTTYEKTL